MSGRSGARVLLASIVLVGSFSLVACQRDDDDPVGAAEPDATECLAELRRSHERIDAAADRVQDALGPALDRNERLKGPLLDEVDDALAELDRALASTGCE
jgi:hypothetical protein